jgi:CDP-diacylglycerol--glycerol-3-phosphate 3-phosphatidyltransferase
VGLAPVVVGLVLLRLYGAAAVVFGAAALTDFADGYLARRWRLTTTFGNFLDTTADKLLVTGALVGLVAIGRASAWVAFIIIGRELLVMALRGLAAADNVVVQASIWGKLKTNVQFLAIIMAMLRLPGRWGPLYPDEWVMWAAAAVTIASGAEYLARFRPVLSAGADRPA